MSYDPIEDLMSDPDRRAKLFLILTVMRILIFAVIIPLGTLIFILRLLGII